MSNPFVTSLIHSILAGSGLASFLWQSQHIFQHAVLAITYQLVEVPPADLHVTLILIQAFGESLRVSIAAASAPAASLVSGLIALSGEAAVLLLLLGRCTATTKHSPDSVSNG